MKYLFIFLLVAAGVLCLLWGRRLKPKTPPTPKTQPKPKESIKPVSVSEYDSEGYNRYGYNREGKNKEGKYNRFYNVKCYKNNLYSEEGFLDARKNPLYLTTHARNRMRERMGIFDEDKMNILAFEAYQFGKSKLQLMRSERRIIEEKEQEHDSCVILIYRGYCYVFSENNGLKTVFKNDRIRM